MRSIDSASGRRAVRSAQRKAPTSPGSLPTSARRRRLQQRLPRGDVVGQPRDGLQFGGFQRRAGNLRLGRELRGIEEAAQRNGDLLVEQQADFAGELMLARDPVLVGRRLKREDRLAADGRSGKSGNEREQRLPLEGGEVGVSRPATEWDRAAACPATILPGVVGRTGPASANADLVHPTVMRGAHVAQMTRQLCQEAEPNAALSSGVERSDGAAGRGSAR